MVGVPGATVGLQDRSPDRVDQHMHLNKTGADVTAHWQHEGQG